MKKLAVLFGLICVLAASASVLTPAAGATPSTGNCAFPIDISVTQKGNPTSVFNLPPSGPFTGGIFGGQVFVTVTNLNNPSKSITVNASGPGFQLADGSLRTTGALLYFASSSTTGDIPGPGIFLVHGPALINGFNTQLLGGTISGNLCAAIA